MATTKRHGWTRQVLPAVWRHGDLGSPLDDLDREASPVVVTAGALGDDLDAVLAVIASEYSGLDVICRVDDELPCPTTLTTPSTVTFVFEPGGILTASSAKTITFYRKIRVTNSSQQIFGSNITARFREQSSNRILYPQWWGALLNGSFNDTTAFSACFAALVARNGGVLNCEGSLVLDALSLVGPNGWIIWNLHGELYLNGMLGIGNLIRFRGTGGAPPSPTQFTRKPQAIVYSHGTTNPTIRMSGQAFSMLENLRIANNQGPAVQNYGAARFFEDNISCNVPDVATAKGMEFVSSFWGQVKNCSMLAAGPDSGDMLDFYNDGTTFPLLGTGIIDIEHTVFAGTGMRITAHATLPIGNIFFHDVIYETALTNHAYLTLDCLTAGRIINGITIDMGEIADPDAGWTAPIIQLEGLPNVQSVKLQNFGHHGYPLVGGGNINGLLIDGLAAFAGGVSGILDLGTQRQNAILHQSGRVDGRIRALGLAASPNGPIYGTPIPINRDASTWSGFAGGDVTLTYPRLAPDGTQTAALVETATIEDGVAAYNASGITVAVGDALVAGVWARAKDNTGTVYTECRIHLVGGTLFDNGQDRMDITAAPAGQRKGDGWSHYVSIGKIASGPGTPLTIFTLAAVPTKPTEYWQPFLLHLPVSLGLRDQDLFHLWQALLPMWTPPSGTTVPVGTYAQFPHQYLRVGQGLYIHEEIDAVVAPGPGWVLLRAVPGTGGGTAKIVAYAGTSTTPVTIADNIGGGF